MLKDLCFEIIQACPNNCLFCSSCASIDKDKKIELDLFKKTIDYLVSLGGIEEISISGGEPFLHPDLFEMIKYCKEKKIRVVLFTSGIKKKKKIPTLEFQNMVTEIKEKYKRYLDQGMEEQEYQKYLKKELDRLNFFNNQEYSEISRMEMEYLKYIGLDKIVFDFQATEEDSYNYVMHTKNMLTNVISSMVKASASNVETDAHFIPMKCNYKEFPDLIECLNIGEIKNLSILNFVPQGRGKDNVSNLSLSREEMEEFKKIYEDNYKKFKGNIRIGIPLIKNDSHMCTAGLDKLVIKYDGTVFPCPAFKEYSLDKLHELGIDTPNIYTDLDKVLVKTGSRSIPLCKQVYAFDKNIK
jgi:MoaA/NifB/PqqE/SkfB family radical SAM enzyme